MVFEKFMVTERGRLENSDNLMLTPHDFAFPSLMSTLAIFMGLPVRTWVSEGHGIQWLDIRDHYTQVGISAEGFGMMYGLPHGVLRDSRFGSAPVMDCFAFLSLPCRLYADSSVAVKDRGLNKPQDFIDIITDHITKNLPAAVLTNEAMQILVTGYENYGKTLRGWVFSDGADNTNKSFHYDLCQLIDNWTDTAFAVITAGEPHRTCNKKDILSRALKRGYDMLTEENKSGYGKKIYKDWSDAMNDDSKFSGSISERPYIDPHIWDLAERRAWTSNFLRDVKSVIPDAELAGAIEAFDGIHDKMWTINSLCSGNDCIRLKDRGVRLQIVDIIKECARLDLKAAECIKNASIF